MTADFIEEDDICQSCFCIIERFIHVSDAGAFEDLHVYMRTVRSEIFEDVIDFGNVADIKRIKGNRKIRVRRRQTETQKIPVVIRDALAGKPGDSLEFRPSHFL